MKYSFSFRNLFLVVAVISSLLLTACGGGGGGGGNAPTQQTSSVKVTIPGSLFPKQASEVRAATSLEKLTLKVVAYKNGKKQTDVKITDREATSNGTNFTATVDGLLNVYDYRFRVYHNNVELLSNLVVASEIVNDANININIETSYKTIAYDSWLKKNPTNASMSNFKENSKSAGITKDSDYSKLALQVGNNNYSVDQFKENIIKAAKGEAASLPTESTAKINVDKIAVTDKDKPVEKTDLYTITYNLNGGAIAKSNPTQYGSASATITLNNPTKDGYNFTGWTGSNGNTPQTTATIQKGSSGNKTYSANWTPISYSISYNLDDGILAKDNPKNYDITSATITLNNPTKDGYNFAGWTGSNDSAPQITVTIPKGSKGNKSFTANWIVKILEGSGTANDPYIVATADDLNKVRLINNGSYFKQTKDIDLSNYGSTYDNGSGWLPIPYSDENDTDNAWLGNYDGNNHKITNLYIERFISKVGLFGRIATDSVISNLSIETSSDGIKATNTVGILAGISHSKKIANCSVNGIIIGFDNDIGGMIGLSFTQNITDCIASCTIYVGTSSTISDPKGKTGGLIGFQLGDSYTISNCNTSTLIESLEELECVGGMFGCCMGNGLISNCRTTGRVKTTGNISGGFVGVIDLNVNIKSCVSSATSIAIGLMAGGFVGTSRGTIELCISDASVASRGDVGGFVGSNVGKISRCYANKPVLLYSENDSAMIAGSFVGQNLSTISDCYSLGPVAYSLGNSSKFTAYTGAFAGQNMENGVINSCYSCGTSMCSFKGCGGIAGCNEGTVKNCAAFGAGVAGYQDVGRIVGENKGTISNCYAISTMTVNDEIPTTNIGTDKINGKTVTASTCQNKSWWLRTLGFSSSIWTYSTSNRRMELKNMPSL